MKVLVLGGTGAMGYYLVKLLEQNNMDVVVTSRSNRESTKKISYIMGNAHENDFFKSIISNKWDVIIDFMLYSTASFRERIDTILESTSQYVFLSSSRVYANSDQPLTEKSPRLLDVIEDDEYLNTDEYALAKARQENILFKCKSKNWTIVRPYITYSHERLQLGNLEKEEWLYRALKGRTIVFSSNILHKTTTLTHGLDVAKGILSVIGDKRAFGESFHITTESFTTWNEILSLYLKIIENELGNRPKVILSDFVTYIDLFPVKYQILYDRLYNRKFNNAKISEYLDKDSFLCFNLGLEMSLKEFLTNPKFKSIDWKKEAFKDKITNERTSLKEISGLKQKMKYLLYRYF